MLFRSTDLLNDFERLTKGLNFGPEFDKVMNDLSAAFASTSTPPAPTPPTPTSPTATSATASNLDAVRSDTRFQIFVDIPGIDAGNVDVAVDGRTLTIDGERTFETVDGERLVHTGRHHGGFSHTIELDDDLDVDGLTARAENGVLIVTMPVIASPEPRKINIEVEG